MDVAEQTSDGAESVVPAHKVIGGEEQQDSTIAELAGAAPAGPEEEQAAEAAGPQEEQAAVPATAEDAQEPALAVQQEEQLAPEDEPVPNDDDQIVAAQAAVESNIPEAAAEEGEATEAAQLDGSAPACADRAEQAAAEQAEERSAGVMACDPAPADLQAEQGRAEPASDLPAVRREQTDQPGGDVDSAKLAVAENQAEQHAAADAATEIAAVERPNAPAAGAAAVLQAPAS